MSKARLLEAVQELDLGSVRELLRARPSLITIVDRQGRNLLQLACCVSTSKLHVSRSTQTHVVNFLLDQGFEIDAPVGRDRCTALFFAVARARNPLLVTRLLDRGAKAALAPGGGLFAAGWWDDIENLELLLQAGAQIDVEVGVTPFLACWCWKKFKAAKFLVEKGANVNYRDARGWTALRHGVEKEFDAAWLKWLVKRGASPDIADREGISARLKAARKRDKRFLAALS
jgi:ankyrin repeat protein